MKMKRFLQVFWLTVILFGVVARAVTAVQAAAITVNNHLDTADPVPGDGVCDVDPGTAGSQCTLRAAIQTAQAMPGADNIHFESSMDINLNSSLPSLAEQGLVIEAASGQVVRINGQSTVANIFRITGSHVTISNVVVYGSGAGWSNIWVSDAAEQVVIAHNLIGDDNPDDGGCGQSDASYGGIYVSSTTPLTDTARVWVYGNIIECHTSLSGEGITIYGTDNVFIGQDPTSAGSTVAENIIRHNQTGVQVIGGANNSINSSAIENNVGHGVWLQSSTETNVVGCGGFSPPADVAACRNRIRGNGGAGIMVGGSSSSLFPTGIAYNWIGLADDGVTAVPNDFGILIGPDSRAVWIISNTISGNLQDGVRITNTLGRHWLWGNTIGLDAVGDTAVPNGSHGVAIFDDAGVNLIGGPEERFSNIISGNSGFGILVNNTISTTINFNSIGVAANGARRGNGYAGLSLHNSADNAIGMVEDEALWGSQRIAGNGEDGIYLENVTDTQIGPGNEITDNGSQGIYLFSSQNNIIAPYLVARNEDEGVQLSGGTSYYNAVFPRNVRSNGRLPIDLGLPGLEPNDPGDADNGPNHLLNYPEVTLISGTVITGTACGPCVVVVYEATGDPTQNGGGGSYRGFTVSDATGVWSVDLAAMGLELRPVSFMTLTGFPGLTSDVDSSPLSPITQLGYALYLPLVLEE